MINKKYLNECFEYRQETGELVWKIRSRDHFKSNSGYTIFNNNYAGKIAGCDSFAYKNRYIRIRLDGKKMYAHRIIWAMMRGEWPKNIDHIDGDGSNNRIDNLRDVSHSTNCKNRSLRSDNKTKISGVSWNERAKKWHAVVTNDNKMNHLGYFADFFEACCVRKSAENKYNFHPNHGR